MSNLATNHNGGHTGLVETRAFGAGKVDPVEAGRRGGVASGLARRLRPQRELELGIVASNNGAAKAKTA